MPAIRQTASYVVSESSRRGSLSSFKSSVGSSGGSWNPLYVLGGWGVFVLHQATVTVCTGDCDGNGSITIDEILSLVNLALGNSATCPSGLASGTIPNVSVILQVVNSALNGCTP